MKWRYKQDDAQWWLESGPHYSDLLAFVEERGEVCTCFLMHLSTKYDAKFPTLAEAKAWCEAMCALEGKT